MLLLYTLEGSVSGELTLTDSASNQLISYTPTKDLSIGGALLPEMAQGQTYTPDLRGKDSTITLSGVVTTGGNASRSGMGGFGGGQRGGMGGRGG